MLKLQIIEIILHMLPHIKSMPKFAGANPNIRFY